MAAILVHANNSPRFIPRNSKQIRTKLYSGLGKVTASGAGRSISLLLVRQLGLTCQVAPIEGCTIYSGAVFSFCFLINHTNKNKTRRNQRQKEGKPQSQLCRVAPERTVPARPRTTTRILNIIPHRGGFCQCQG